MLPNEIREMKFDHFSLFSDCASDSDCPKELSHCYVDNNRCIGNDMLL